MNVSIDSKHEFYYNTTEPVTIESLADSLIGLEAILKKSVKVACKELKIEVKDTQLLIDSITIASYKDSIILRLFIGDEQEVEAAFEAFRKTMKIDTLSKKLALGTFLCAGLGYGAYHVLKKNPAPVTNNTSHYNVTISDSFNKMGKPLGYKDGELLKTFEKSFTEAQKDSMAKDALRILKPAGKDASGTVTIDGNVDLVIPKEVVQSLPAKLDKKKEKDPFEAKFDVSVSIRTLDLDSKEKGWMATIQEISTSRVKLTFAQDIDPNQLPTGKVFLADVIVIYRKTKKGNVPKEYQLVRRKDKVKPLNNSKP